jgi:DNA-binding NarL/FixJ family response regulator
MASIDHSSKDTRQPQTGQPATGRPPVRVYLVEDETSVRERICEVINGDARLQLAGDTALHTMARRWLVDGRHSLDVLLVDLGLPDGSGLDLIAECRQLRPDVAIMVMTMFGDERHVFTALARGAAGYLLKSTPANSIAEHILDLHAGGSPITPTVARLVLKRMSLPPGQQTPPPSGNVPLDPPPSALPEALSVRELDVLNQISVGYNTTETARRPPSGPTFSKLASNACTSTSMAFWIKSCAPRRMSSSRVNPRSDGPASVSFVFFIWRVLFVAEKCDLDNPFSAETRRLLKHSQPQTRGSYTSLDYSSVSDLRAFLMARQQSAT